VERKYVQIVCVWGGEYSIFRSPEFPAAGSLRYQERLCVQKSISREEMSQKKKPTIGLDKRTKGKDLGYNEGQGSPDVQGIQEHGKV
jgi:hypothetical protein